MRDLILKTDIKEYPLLTRGKVRDVYDLDGRLLIVATDRISAFDWVLPNGIPGKGKILNSMSCFWFSFVENIVPNHVLIDKFENFPESLKKYEDQLKGRSMIVKKARRIDIECVARGYIVGSGYKDYKKALELSPKADSIDLYGNLLPVDLKVADKLPFPIFTPSTKEEQGHDENITYSHLIELIGEKLVSQLREITLSIYSQAFSYAINRGIIIADTKFEFGFIDNKLTLIDEILSPDSSRFWPVESYRPGENPPSFDKQYIRDWLESCGWDKASPPPPLPEEVVKKTLDKYKAAYRVLTGKEVDQR